MFKAMLKENYYPYEDIYGSIASGVLGLATAGLNYGIQGSLMKQDRETNYKYNEMAAQNADARTRALYRDIYSPEALLRQYREAGLSPSMMYGGTPGQGGMSGAQGAGANGPTTPYYPVNMLEMAQAANLMAQTKKTEAETTNIQKDTDLKALEKDYKELANEQYKNEWNLINTPMYNEDGTETSIYETAQQCNDWDEFISKVRSSAERGGRDDIKMFTATEAGQKQLRQIYITAARYDHDITVLSSEKTSAAFQQEIVRAMKKEGFADMNAQAAIQYLKANIQTGELQETQKEAWNNLLNRMEKGTTRDIIVVLGMILNNAMTNWKMPNFGDNITNHTTNVYNKQ